MPPTAIQDDLSRLREELCRRREAAGLTRDGLADLASLRLVSGDFVLDKHFIRHLETRRTVLPPRVMLEPIGEVLGLEWSDILRLIGWD